MNSFVQMLQSSLNNEKMFPENNFDEKIALMVYTAILKTPIATLEEENRRYDFLENINRIIHNYDEVIEVLQTNLESKFKKKSFTYEQER